MRRRLLCFALVLAACSKGEQAADTTAAAPPPPPIAITAADLAGTWETKSMPMDRDTVVATSQIMSTGTMEGWTMKVTGNPTAIPVKVLAIGGDSVVTETGQFNSVLRKGQKVSIHSIQHLKDGKLTGVIHARYSNGDTATLRVEGTKTP